MTMLWTVHSLSFFSWQSGCTRQLTTERSANYEGDTRPARPSNEKIGSLATTMVTATATATKASPKKWIRAGNYRYNSTSFKCWRFFVALVVQTLDRAIQRIIHYPADKYEEEQLRYPLD